MGKTCRAKTKQPSSKRRGVQGVSIWNRLLSTTGSPPALRYIAVSFRRLCCLSWLQGIPWPKSVYPKTFFADVGTPTIRLGSLSLLAIAWSCWCFELDYSYPLFREFGRQRSMTLVTSSRRRQNKSENRINMHRLMRTPKLKQIYKERSYRVEPMQGLVKDIFDLDRCSMRGNNSNRWLFATIGVTVQLHQLTAFKEKLQLGKSRTRF